MSQARAAALLSPSRSVLSPPPSAPPSAAFIQKKLTQLHRPASKGKALNAPSRSRSPSSASPPASPSHAPRVLLTIHSAPASSGLVTRPQADSVPPLLLSSQAKSREGSSVGHSPLLEPLAMQGRVPSITAAAASAPATAHHVAASLAPGAPLPPLPRAETLPPALSPRWADSRRSPPASPQPAVRSISLPSLPEPERPSAHSAQQHQQLQHVTQARLELSRAALSVCASPAAASSAAFSASFPSASSAAAPVSDSTDAAASHSVRPSRASVVTRIQRSESSSDTARAAAEEAANAILAGREPDPGEQQYLTIRASYPFSPSGGDASTEPTADSSSLSFSLLSPPAHGGGDYPLSPSSAAEALHVLTSAAQTATPQPVLAYDQQQQQLHSFLGSSAAVHPYYAVPPSPYAPPAHLAAYPPSHAPGQPPLPFHPSMALPPMLQHPLAYHPDLAAYGLPALHPQQQHELYLQQLQHQHYIASMQQAQQQQHDDIVMEQRPRAFTPTSPGLYSTPPAPAAFGPTRASFHAVAQPAAGGASFLPSFVQPSPSPPPASQQQKQALLSSVRNGRYAELVALLQSGVPPNSCDRYGNSALHVACQTGNKRIVKQLLRCGADMNAVNLQGNSPLHYAFAYHYDPLAAYLISKGADDRILNYFGLSCYDGLRQDSRDEAAKALHLQADRLPLGLTEEMVLSL